MDALKNILNADKIIWSGTGHSFALAELFALMTKLNYDKVSLAAKKSELESYNESWKKIFISQSGNLPKNKIDLIITQHKNTVKHEKICIESPYDEIPWFALDYFKNLVIEISKYFNVSCHKNDSINGSISKKKVLLVFDKYSQPLKQFLDATTEKISEVELQLTELGDFGHGYHQQVYNDRFEEIVLCISDQDAFNEIKQWLNKINKSYKELNIQNQYSVNTIINNFLFLLNYIKLYLENFRVEYLNKKIPLELDKLR